MSLIQNNEPIDDFKNLPYVEFTTNEFLEWRSMIGTLQNLSAGSFNDDNITLAKFYIATGLYDQGRVCLARSGNPVIISKGPFENIRNRDIWTMADILERIKNVKNERLSKLVNKDDVSFLDLLNEFYSYGRKIVITEDYDVQTWVIIAKFVEALVKNNVIVYHPNFSDVQYCCLRQSVNNFFESMANNNLLHILDCYGLLKPLPTHIPSGSLEGGKFVLNMRIKTSHIKHYIIFIQMIVDKWADHYTNKGKFGAKTLLIDIYETCRAYENYELMLFCLGVNFNCRNVSKIQSREKFESYKFMCEEYTDIYSSFNDRILPESSISGAIRGIILQKLTIFREEHYFIFDVSDKLNDEYIKLTNIILPLSFVTYEVLRRLVEFINKCYRLLLVEQKYRPGGNGYVEANNSYNDTLIAMCNDVPLTDQNISNDRPTTELSD